MRNLLSVIWIFPIIISLGLICGCLEDFDNSEEADFTGSYNVTGTETINGKSSQITDTITISEDTPDNLSVKTQNFGVLDAVITSSRSFRINEQKTTVKTSSGNVEVTIEGLGSVSADLLDFSGSYSIQEQVVKFNLSGFQI